MFAGLFGSPGPSVGGFLSQRSFVMFGWLLAIMGAATMAVAVANTTYTYINFDSQKDSCAPGQIINMCPVKFVYISSGIWGSVPVFLAGIVALRISRAPGASRLLQILVLLSLMVFTPAMIIINAIEIVAGNQYSKTAVPVQIFYKVGTSSVEGDVTKFVLPLVVAVMAGLEFIILLFFSCYLYVNRGGMVGGGIAVGGDVYGGLGDAGFGGFGDGFYGDDLGYGDDMGFGDDMGGGFGDYGDPYGDPYGGGPPMLGGPGNGMQGGSGPIVYGPQGPVIVGGGSGGGYPGGAGGAGGAASSSAASGGGSGGASNNNNNNNNIIVPPIIMQPPAPAPQPVFLPLPAPAPKRPRPLPLRPVMRPLPPTRYYPRRNYGAVRYSGANYVAAVDAPCSGRPWNRY